MGHTQIHVGLLVTFYQVRVLYQVQDGQGRMPAVPLQQNNCLDYDSAPSCPLGLMDSPSVAISGEEG